MVRLYRQVTQNLLRINGNDEQEDSPFQEENAVATGGTLQLQEGMGIKGCTAKVLFHLPPCLHLSTNICIT